MPAVEVEDLVIRYGDLTAVDHLSLACDAGTVTALLGVNGAGKTSTIEVLEGLRRPSAGRARVLGLEPWTRRDELATRMGVMPQDPGLPPSGRPLDLVRLYGSLHGIGIDPEGQLDAVGLADRATTSVRRLSGGERQRLSLALALIGRADVLFLDEPTAGVDVHGRMRIRELVAERAEQGAAVILTTHELDEARRMSDQLVIIDRGAVVASGTVAEMSQAMGEPTGLRFTAASGLDVIGLSDVVGGHVVEERPGEYHADVDPQPRLVAALTAWLAEQNVTIEHLDTGRASLDDVFTRLTGTGAADEAGTTS